MLIYSAQPLATSAWRSHHLRSPQQRPSSPIRYEASPAWLLPCSLQGVSHPLARSPLSPPYTHSSLTLNPLPSHHSSTCLQFLDDGSKVKVYIHLEGVGAAISDESISPVFTERSISISIKDYPAQPDDEAGRQGAMR